MGEQPEPALPPFARGPVFAAAATIGGLLTAFSAGYGYERDELYFRMLPPAWGYIDQPPLTPLIARAFRNMFGDNTWAVRIPATLATMLAVLVIALITREVGGGRAAQTLSAWGFAFAAFPVILGHVLLTATLDMPVWPAVLLFAVRAIRREQPRWWLAAGVVAGLSTYNKLLVAVLVISLLAGVLLVGPRQLLRSRWLLGAVGLGVLVGLPNLVYQAANGWPQLAMGRALAANNAGDVHILMWPFLLVLLGPPLAPILIAGLLALWRDRRLRFVAVSFPVMLALVFVMGAQFYYPFGLLAVLFAVGCRPAWNWAAKRVHRRRWLLAGVGLNAAVSCVVGLPLIPVDALHVTPIPAMSQVVQDSVGWPRYVSEIAAVYRRLPATERAHTVIYASNYGEAGAVDRYGPGDDLPAVYSGQNQLGHEGRPPASATTAVFVGGQYGDANRWFASCAVMGRLDDGAGVDNEEQGEPIAICRGPDGGWSRLWPRMRHLD